MVTVVKIGTESLLDFDDSQKIENVVQDITKLMLEQKEHVLLVTSGAVGFGRLIRPDITDKQVLASIGWGALLSKYTERFRKYKITIGGLLVTHADIEDSAARSGSLKRTVELQWQSGVLPIINENDALSLEEMDAIRRGADNDQNAYLLAKLFRARQLYIITNTNGVYRDKDNSDSRIGSIKGNDISEEQIHEMCGGELSSQGTGGMKSKMQIAKKAARHGIRTHIGNGLDSRLSDMNSGGTTILPCN